MSSYYYNLGAYSRRITGNPCAQTWFDRGLVWSYGFNHEEAASCFSLALSHDPSCAMAHWGLAYALGPNYNKPWDLFDRSERSSAASRAHAAVLSALTISHVTPTEAALIAALATRYPSPLPPSKADRPLWNTRYADAMAAVSKSFPDDLDVAALYADAMMNLHPWSLWDIHSGLPAEGSRTADIRRVLEHALSLPGGDSHPGLLHLYIHLMEMSSEPQVALPAANLLRGLVPDSGHLEHMPSHIDVLLGDYASAISANSAAVDADERFFARQSPLRFYTLYRCHNYHFRLYAAMFAGQYAVALDSASRLEAAFSDDLLRVQSPPLADWLEPFFALRIHVLVRFGRWGDIIALPLPSDAELYCVTTALTHYAKGIAFAALGRIDDARSQQRLFADAVPRVKPSRKLFNNRCVDILGVAEALLAGEVEFRSANYDAAFASLRTALARYDALPFDEPWGWMQPVRHALGALLLERGRLEEALAVYAADLGIDPVLPRVHRHPDNVWALHGYREALARLGREKEAAALDDKLRAALDRADVPIASSCFCRLRTAKM